MPYKPKRACSSPGCPNLTAGNLCEQHSKQEAARYERFQRDPDTAKRYNYTWRKIRAAYITAHPLCTQCLRDGLLTPAQEVHHIKPLAQGGTHETDNLMALCTSCHSRITAQSGDRWG
ncbi:restriction endonuclease [Clostridia bacterium]|nr:restriction endonuclease [Clostridia bacterium]